MGKGSIRQKGSKWYYRFYVSDESGRRIQKEFAGGKNKHETEIMLRHAIEEYENHNYFITSGNLTVSHLLDLWFNEELKISGKSNGTIMVYQKAINQIKKHAVGRRKLKTVTSEHLQNYVDVLCFGEHSLSSSSIRAYMAVLNGAFRYAVFPKRLLYYNPMEYVIHKNKQTNPVLFHRNTQDNFSTITCLQFQTLCCYLKNHPVLLPVQIAYYTGLRVGEVCALTWDDINLDENFFFVQRTLYYNNETHHIEVDAPKGRKPRIVDFGSTLQSILKDARKKQLDKSFNNYYRIVSDYGRKHYEIYSFPSKHDTSTEYFQIPFICQKQDGTFLTPNYIGSKCRQAAKELNNFEGFHFHMLRHTFASNLIQNGASPKEVQELLGHADIKLTMNIYAHSDRESRRSSVKILDELSLPIHE